MSEIQSLIIKDDDQEYTIYLESKTAPEVIEEEEPGYRDGLPTLNIKDFQDKIRDYAKLAVGAFKNLPEAEEVTVKFGIKLGGKTGIPFLTEGSAESNFEIEVKYNLSKKVT
ncbi:CU044_2847 family protein [Anabaena sp. UHCC 0399]|uniref:CU044_2847 family protein n=1 Tax=Anabaena sp. UHCC 0399 TaxID=3110238 RepID=UPI002B1FA580|nr:CU044_2847 family protein [Anabaena sp. UHCC 0399]MEA5564213.1 CU044_2847 family protein [Anabaena sp. UHCC 0399]